MEYDVFIYTTMQIYNALLEISTIYTLHVRKSSIILCGKKGRLLEYNVMFATETGTIGEVAKGGIQFYT